MQHVVVSVEISAAVDTGEYLAVSTLILVVFLHLILLQGRATRITSEEDHTFNPRGQLAEYHVQRKGVWRVLQNSDTIIIEIIWSILHQH